ncbi:MAG TPA: hypothetical protein VFY20_12030 [Gemmatimonadales bacterium]|nr:hypothetical protein [Gemmatimonadales bacterium]
MRRLLAALLLLLPATAAAQRATRDWPPEDRAVIGDFSVVTSVAATFDRVYATSRSMLVIWRPLERRWEGPFEPGVPGALERVFRAAADPLDQSLWMVRPDGWLHYQPDMRTWERGVIPGQVRELVFDETDQGGGPFIGSSSGWYRVPPGGFSAMPSPPPRRPMPVPGIDDALRANPALQANAALILNDGRGRGGAYTSASPSKDGIGWYIGTAGNGLMYLPPGSAMPQRLSYGLVGDRVGALFAVPGGVWVATDRQERAEPALTFVASDLSRFDVRRGSAMFGLGYQQVRRIVSHERALWLATDQGVVRVEGESDRTERVDLGRGLPDSRVYSLLSRRGALYAGTARGVGRVNDSLRAVRVAESFNGAVLSMEQIGDTLWIGSTDGVLLVPPRSVVAGRTPGLSQSASFRQPVVALARLGDTLVALTENQFLWREPEADVWNLGPPLSALLGRLVAFAPYRDGFFVAGEQGIGFATLNSAPQSPLLGQEHPGRIRDIAADRDFVWVGTERGVVRWRIGAILP